MKEFILKVNEQAINEEPELEKYLQTLQLIVNRMMMSHFKYGRMMDKYPLSAKAVESAKQRTNYYKDTGNTEGCLDAANFLLIEFLYPSHRKAKFQPKDSGDMGIIWRED